MAQYGFQNIITFCLLLLAWSQPALAGDNNPSTDMVVGLSVAAGGTIALLVILCFAAQCVPVLCYGHGWKDETWFNDHNDKDVPPEDLSSPMIEKPAPIAHPMYR